MTSMCVGSRSKPTSISGTPLVSNTQCLRIQIFVYNFVSFIVEICVMYYYYSHKVVSFMNLVSNQPVTLGSEIAATCLPASWDQVDTIVWAIV